MPDSTLPPHADMGRRLAERIGAHVSRDGFNDTVVDGLALIAASDQRPREPVCYHPSLIFIVQGHKTGYVDDRVIHYGPGHYLVQAMPLPFECETSVGPDTTPLLGAAVRLEGDMLAELVAEWPTADQGPERDESETLPMAAVELDTDMAVALMRLIDCLDDPAAARVLATGRIREIVFAALRGPQGHLLRQLMVAQGVYARIGRAIARLQAEYDRPLSVTALATVAHMSVSSFHEHFKRTTRLSPLQYQKRLRLLRARELLFAHDRHVAGVANAVGYQSASQFSREYKRYFGIAPVDHARYASA